MKINHIGYLVGNIHEAIKQFKELGYINKSEIIEDALRKINICFLEKDGYCIELVSAMDENSVVYNMYKKFQNTPYHVCYAVEDINGSIVDLKKKGYILTQPIQDAVAFEGKKVVFLYHKQIGLIELVEIA